MLLGGKMNTMQSCYGCLAALLLIVLQPATVSAARVSSKVVDRLGRPVTNVLFDVHWLKEVSKDDVRKIDLVKLVSDRNGIVKGKYDGKSLPRGEHAWVEISKVGYCGYTSSGLRAEFVLRREFGAADISRIAALAGKTQVDELRELLAGEFTDSGEDLHNRVFVQEHKFRPGLRAIPGTSARTTI